MLGHRRDLSSTVYPGHERTGGESEFIYTYFLNSLTSFSLANAHFDSYLFPDPLEPRKYFFISLLSSWELKTLMNRYLNISNLDDKPCDTLVTKL